MMITSHQQREALKRESRVPRNAQLATVGRIYPDGISLIFDGDTTETHKHYRYNLSADFSSGQRVKVCKIGGSYIVEYPIG